MRLRENEIDLVARRVASKLMGGAILVDEDVEEGRLPDLIRQALIDDLRVEENLNREVEDILKGHMKEIQSGSIDYRRMFAMIKNKLAKDRNIIIS